jgi:hypothetical protein
MRTRYPRQRGLVSICPEPSKVGSKYAKCALAQVIATVLFCWVASGIVFGFAALKPVLVNEGVYRELCTKEELDADVEICYEQDLRLNFFFVSGRHLITPWRECVLISDRLLLPRRAMSPRCR